MRIFLLILFLFVSRVEAAQLKDTIINNDLTLDTNGTLLFEGSTSDANEHIIGVIDPSADRTFNFPNDEMVAGDVLVASGTSNLEYLSLSIDGLIVIGDGSGIPSTLDVGSSTAITIVGALASGSIGTGFGTINNATTIQGTVLTGTTSLVTTGGLIEDTDNEDLVLRTNSNANQLVLDAAGNVGIGTATPWESLIVVGDFVVSDSTPRMTLRDLTDDVAYAWHLTTEAGHAAINNLSLLRGTDNGSTGFQWTTTLSSVPEESVG